MGAILIDSPQLRANEYLMARNAAELLHRHYPGHLWAVNIEASMCNVRNMYLAGDWGYRLAIPDMFSASDWDKKVLRAGGEILERYRQRRAGADDAALHTLPTNFAGLHTPDL